MPRQTFHAKPGEVEPTWRHIDAEGKILGRLATQVATFLMGKHRPEYTPHVLCGDYVIITNAEKITMTGNKLDHKTLRRYSGYPGGQKVETYRRVLEKDPERLVRQAIVRMLPSTILGRQMERRLKIYPGPDHPHASANPQTTECSTA
jgi:large subunit ribosomal protein L13